MQVCGMWKRWSVYKFVECGRGGVYTSLWNVVEVKCIQNCESGRGEMYTSLWNVEEVKYIQVCGMC